MMDLAACSACVRRLSTEDLAEINDDTVCPFCLGALQWDAEVDCGTVSTALISIAMPAALTLREAAAKRFGSKTTVKDALRSRIHDALTIDKEVSLGL